MSGRSPAVRLALALLGIAAVSVAAASLRETTAPGTGADAEPGPLMRSAHNVIAVPELPYGLIAVLFVLTMILGTVWLAVVHPHDITRWVLLLIGLFLFGSTIATLIYIAPGIDQTAEEVGEELEPYENDTAAPAEGDSGEDDPLLSVSLGPTIIILGSLFALLAFAILINTRTTTSDGPAPLDAPDAETDSPPDDGSPPAGIGAVAATAVGDLDAAEDVDNEIYRAWASMAALLEVDDPETSTPGEFQAAAIEAGMKPAHVRELTTLFETVRYGNAEPTAERVERARGTFERIAETYGAEQQLPDADGSDRPDTDQ